MRKNLVLVVILAVLLCSCVTGWKIEDPDAALFRVSFLEQELTIYDIASEITGCPAEILRGIHFAESSYGENLDHPGDFYRGPFGLNERFRSERVQKWGEYNPDCPLDSAIVAGCIIMEHYEKMGDMEQAISAYRHGRVGTYRNGIDRQYVSRVKYGWSLYCSV